MSDTKPTLVPIWTINQEDCDGRYTGVRWHYSNPDIAAENTKGKGAWGGRGTVVEEWGIEVDGLIYRLASKDPIDLDGQLAARRERLKAQGLAKLNPDEREALGL